MNYYYLVFLILLFLSGAFFAKVVNGLVGIGVSVLGIVSLMAYVYYYTMDEPDNTITEWPSETYLRTVGAQCPNYWKLVANESTDEKVVCKYTLEDPPLIEDKCFDDKTKKTKTFNRVNKITYPLTADEERDKWRDECRFRLMSPNDEKVPWIEYDGIQ